MRIRHLIPAACVLLLAGCVSRTQELHTAEAFDPAVLAEGPLVLGGFVASSRLDDAYPDDPGTPAAGELLAQSEAWCPLLLAGFRAEAPDLAVWGWPVLTEAWPDTAFAPGLRVFARGGLLRAKELAPYRTAAPEARFVVLARLDGNETSLHEPPGSLARNQRDHDGRDLHASEGVRTVTVRRELKVTLEVYDLRDERSLWVGQVRRQARDLYTPPTRGEPAPADTTGAPGIRVEGTPRQGPPLTQVLGDACEDVVARLLRKGD